jgi:hypothetical protein
VALSVRTTSGQNPGSSRENPQNPGPDPAGTALAVLDCMTSTHVRWISWFRALCFMVIACLPLFGNGCAATAPVKPRPSVRQEAVVIDFYKDGKKSAACSGTLLAQNVVLTAAHCTSGSTSARVIAPNAGGKRVSVGRVYRFDWTPEDPTMDPARRNDIALLVLRKPIELPSYPKIEARACPGCKVRLVGRTHGDGGAREDVTESEQMRIARTLPAGRPLNLFVDRGISDSGGAVFRQAPGKTRTLVGISVGRGQTTGGGYIARLDNPLVHDWIRAVAFTVSRKSTGPTSSPMDESGGEDWGSGDTGSGDYGSGDDYGSGGDYNDPIDYGSGDTGSGDNGSGDYGSDDNGSGDYGSGDNGSGDYGSGDYGSGEDTGSGDYGDGTGYDPNDPYSDTSENPGTEDPGTETPGWEEPGTETPGSEDPGSQNPETPDSYQNDQQNTPDNPGESQAPSTPEEVNQTGNTASDQPNQENPTNPDTQNTNTQENEPAPEEYTDPAKIQYTPTPGSKGEFKSSNLYLDATKNDPAFKNTQAYAQQMAGQNVSVYGAHGYPGQIAATPNPAAAQQLMKDGKEVVMVSCFAGALPNENGTQMNNAHYFAQEAGGDPSKVYGCTSYAYSFPGSTGCYGNWVDGNGNFVSDQKKQQLGLKTCTPAMWKNGLPYGAENLCQ